MHKLQIELSPLWGKLNLSCLVLLESIFKNLSFLACQIFELAPESKLPKVAETIVPESTKFCRWTIKELNTKIATEHKTLQNFQLQVYTGDKKIY